MKKGMKVLILSLMVAILTACGAGDPRQFSQEEEEGPVLEMATNASFPPFESYNTDGEMVGFDIELANIIADRLGYQLSIQDMKFDGLIGALQMNRVDIVMAGMTATEERRQNVDFSIPYYNSGELFVTRPGSSITALEDLEGKTVGVQLGTIQDEGVTALSEQYGFDVQRLDNPGLLMQELNADRIDAVYLDQATAQGFIEEQNLDYFEDPSQATPGYAVAFPKGSNLIDEINAVLEELWQDGTLKELEDKYITQEEQA